MKTHQDFMLEFINGEENSDALIIDMLKAMEQLESQIKKLTETISSMQGETK